MIMLYSWSHHQDRALLSACCCCCQVASVVSNSVPPHRRQPTRLPRSWDSPGKNTGVGCHFLLQCIKVKVKSLSHAWLLATPWTAAYQAPSSMDFPGKSTGVGCHNWSSERVFVRYVISPTSVGALQLPFEDGILPIVIHKIFKILSANERHTNFQGWKPCHFP